MRSLDFYYLGRRLAESAITEAEYRTAIGRLYYGLHHEACCRFFRENPDSSPLGRGSRHRVLAERYGGQRNESEQRIARLLTQASTIRNLADYELSEAIRYEDREYSARELLDVALVISADLLAELESFSPGEAPEGCDCPTVRGWILAVSACASSSWPRGLLRYSDSALGARQPPRARAAAMATSHE